MDSIIFLKLFNFITPFFFIIFGIYGLIKAKKNFFTLFLGGLFVVIGLINLYRNITIEPNFFEVESFFREYKSIVKDSVKEIVVEVRIINRKPTNQRILVQNKKDIAKIINALKSSKSLFFESEDWSIKNSYLLKLVTEKHTYELNVNESQDSRSYIDLIYNLKNQRTRIGRYTNKQIENINFIELGKRIE